MNWRSVVQETWKPVVGYEGLYDVSDLGNVRRVAKYLNSKDEPLKPSIVGGYPRVTLSKNNVRKSIHNHRLVCDAFIGIPEGMTVNHKNGIKSDCRLVNLEVVTRAENENHKWTVLKNGARNLAKINQAIAEQIRTKRAEGLSLSQLAKQFGLSKSNISFIVNGVTWVK